MFTEVVLRELKSLRSAVSSRQAVIFDREHLLRSSAPVVLLCRPDVDLFLPQLFECGDDGLSI